MLLPQSSGPYAATEAWIIRGVLGEEKPFHTTSLAWNGPWFAYVSQICGLDTSADPALEEVLAARERGQTDVRNLLRDSTPERIAEPCPPNTDVGYPMGGRAQAVSRPAVHLDDLQQEWWHHLDATRDLDQLEGR